jgi:hypothetical protein
MADPEIAAMTSVSDAFEALDLDARRRVLRWAADKYGVEWQEEQRAATPDGAANLTNENGSDKAAARESGQAATYEHFADLYDAAGPTSSADKALVGAYWAQVLQGNSQWASQSVNTELKNLGHGLKRINDALASNIAAKPALVLQVRKSSNSAQARKTYKLTNEGIKAVERMVSGTGA